MCNLTVLALATDSGWLERLWTGLRELSGCRLIVATTLDEAREILECLGPKLLVVDGDPGMVPDERVDELLWSNSTLAHPAIVVVAAGSYDPECAVSLFQMGVDEYLGGQEHWSRLPGILDQLLSFDAEGSSTTPVLRLSNAVPARMQTVPAAPLRWVSAEPA